ncbi:hypothetical protein E2562_027609 [Oryza meyeriana var. granulata]|uniref:Uncharacterized protein n=1 Tax=Oryza meyeriana var. granulata TaxID=110450 RepID=A0A6G1DR96_9ORYZ|nr:hypothetical protein E2562_027609 [Oryza meyeriana var. granulata]
MQPAEAAGRQQCCVALLAATEICAMAQAAAGEGDGTGRNGGIRRLGDGAHLGDSTRRRRNPSRRLVALLAGRRSRSRLSEMGRSFSNASLAKQSQNFQPVMGFLIEPP